MTMLYNALISLLYTTALKLAGEAAEEIARLTKLAQEELTDKTGPEKKVWLMAELKKTRGWFRSKLAVIPSTLAWAVVDVLIAQTKVGQK